MGAVPARAMGARSTRAGSPISLLEQIESRSPTMCVSPPGDRSTVDLVTIPKEKSRHGNASPRQAWRIETTRDKLHRIAERCWSFPASAFTCILKHALLRRTGGGRGRDSSHDSAGRLLYIQSMTVGTQTGVRVQRYREATGDLLLPDESRNAAAR